MNDYRLYRRYPSGCDILVGIFSSKDAALSYKRKLEEKNPLSQYHIREL